MSKNAITPFQRSMEHWEIMHSRQTTASVGEKISGAISDHAKQLAKSANQIIISQERIAEGLENFNIGMERLSEGLDSLTSYFEWGFSEIIWNLEQQRNVLMEIKGILEAPLDTQAKELRKRAEEAYKNGWMDESFEDFLESEKKNRYDFTVHHYLGNIYFFEKKNPEQALSYYEKATKYATPKSPYHASLSLLHIGLIRYIQEDYQKAYEATLKAIELTPRSLEAHFQCAQYGSVLGNVDEAISHLSTAIEGDIFYCIKADKEKDFDWMRVRILEMFEENRKKANALTKKKIDKANELIQEAEYWNAQSYSSSAEKLKRAKEGIEKAEKLFDRNSIFDYVESFNKAMESQNSAIDSLIDSLYVQISETEKEFNEQSKKDKDKKEKSRTLAFLFSPAGVIISYIFNKDCNFAFGVGAIIFLALIIYSWLGFSHEGEYKDKLAELKEKCSTSQKLKEELKKG